MTAQVIYGTDFKRSNPKADRAFWIGADKPAFEAIGPNAIYHYASDQILFADTAPSELNLDEPA